MNSVPIFIFTLCVLRIPSTLADEICKKERNGLTWDCKEPDRCLDKYRSVRGPCFNPHHLCCPPPPHSVANFFCETENSLICRKYDIEEVNNSTHSYSVSILYKNKLGCRGALISERFVLSSASCAKHRDFGVAELVLVGGFRVGIAEVIVAQEGDVALFRLKTKLKLSKVLRPACLYPMPKVSYAVAWTPVTIQVRHQAVREVAVIEGKDPKCRAASGRFSEVLNTSHIICATLGYTGSEDEVIGAPLVVKMGDRCLFSVAGVRASTGKCCKADVPGVFSRVYPRISWIQGIVWPLQQGYRDVHEDN